MFLDVWGLGNRGMFRTLRDLLLRPGYMIRDYLSGMQMAYFPPFKMFFLLSTLSLAIQGGLNVMGRNQFKKESVNVVLESPDTTSADTTGQAMDAIEKSGQVVTQILDFFTSFPTLFSLFCLVLLSAFLYPFFRKCPAIPDLRYSELVVATIYMANMYSAIRLVKDFFCIDNVLLEMAILLLMLVPLRQLSGFSTRKSFLYTTIAIFLMAVSVTALVICAIFIAWLFVK